MRNTEAAPPVLDDSRERLRVFRWVALQSAAGWSLGAEQDYLGKTLRQWGDDYDWREVESRLQAMPWVIVESPDAPVRLVHQRPAGTDAVEVVLVHAWPDFALRFAKVLSRLTHVNAVVPAYPGYPFAAPTTRAVSSAADIAEVIAEAVSELGYDRYLVSGVDVGTDVAEWLVAEHPDRVTGLHLTDLSHRYALIDLPEDTSDEEKSYLAAWIVEKLFACFGPGGGLDSVFSLQDVLDWVTAYWVTGAMDTSFAPILSTLPSRLSLVSSTSAPTPSRPRLNSGPFDEIPAGQLPFEPRQES